MTTLQGTERERERKLILDGAWPHFPILPVKRGNCGEDGIGLLAWRFVPEGREHTSGPWVVYMANLWDISSRADTISKEKDGQPVSWAEALTGVQKIEYATLDDFFDAGWRGD